MHYSYKEFFADRLKKFIQSGETPEGTPHTLLNPNAPDGPKEEPIGVSVKLPPFKGWLKDLQV